VAAEKRSILCNLRSGLEIKMKKVCVVFRVTGRRQEKKRRCNYDNILPVDIKGKHKAGNAEKSMSDREAQRKLKGYDRLRMGR
jgi:hypothetical protein